MLTLAIDTSERNFSVALLENERVLGHLDSRTANPQGNSQGFRAPNIPISVSVALFPMLSQLLAASNLQLRAVELIAIANGPGMFTGLRVGVVTAKTLAYVNQIPLIGVNTLEVLAVQAAEAAYGSQQAGTFVKPVINAQRQQLFAGVYQLDKTGVMVEVEPNRIVDRQDWFAGLVAGDLVTGTGLQPLVEELETLPIVQNGSVRIADQVHWGCSAIGVGQVGMRQFWSGQRSDLWTLEPFYFRPSAAEEKLKS